MPESTYNQTVYSINKFLSVDVASWGERLKAHHRSCMQEEARGPQRKAWFDCFNVLREELGKIRDKVNKEASIVFEYELPRERGRRPDVILLSGRNLIVLEFKGYAQENQAQIDQVKHYARDLSNYHKESSSLNVIPILVLAQGSQKAESIDGIKIVSGDQLGESLTPLFSGPFPEINEWYQSEYFPLPSLVRAAQLLFKENSFPQIKRAQSAGIPNTLKIIHQIALKAEREKSHELVLITGVPGAGKTLVGLQFVFEEYAQEKEQKAVFLSGNGPLVDVLQKSLRNKHFVHGVHGFLKHYAHSSQVPRENVIVYDEAQRAWDSEKVNISNRQGSNSEPTDFVRIADRKGHCVLVGLIGEGQEIHLGEESGIQLWTEAVKNSNRNWQVHCPQKLKSSFSEMAVTTSEKLNLTTSLRTHQALTLQRWVESVLEGDISIAHDQSKSLWEDRYPIYLTRDLLRAKQYVAERYNDEPEKTYGLMASSKSLILPKFGVRNDYNSTRFNPEYYVDPNSPIYCRKLNKVVTEFGCQGLELDMPIIAWEKDWIYENGWINKGPNHKAKDPDNLKKNAYRVLLTRGRDGVVIFIPKIYELDKTYNFLLSAGAKKL